MRQLRLRPTEPAGQGLLAALVAAPLLWLGPPGLDSAAHVYQRAVFLHHGLALWNNLWYGGRYSFVDYSLLYYPLAVIGIRLLALASVVAAAMLFGRLALDAFGRAAQPAALSFAVLWGASVVTGAYPFLLGAALGLAALRALRQRGKTRFAILVALTLAASPLAFAFLGLILAAFWLTARERRRWQGAAIVVLSACATALLLFRLFPAGGLFPFHWSDYLAALTFSLLGLALTWQVERARPLAAVFAVYLLAVTGSFLVPSIVGANMTRLRFAALPLALLVLALRRWRPLLPALASLALAFSWNTTPLLSSYAQAAADQSSQPAYWQPAVDYLGRHLSPDYRVEVVDTSGHWGAVYLPEHGIPIARGWFRQQDFPENAALYHPLDQRSYLAWLRRLGVGYVVLTDAQSDYSAIGERGLITSGRSGLELVFASGHLRVYRVPQPQALLEPAGAVVHLGTETVVLALPRAGWYRLAVRYSPYWQAVGADVCLRPGGDGFIRLHAAAGQLRLRFALSGDGALAALKGQAPSCARQRG